MKITERAGVIFDRIIDVFLAGAAFLIVMDAIAISVDVILRKVAKITWPGLFEIMEYTIIWMTFLGTTWLLRRNGHIRMDAVVSRLNPRHQAITGMGASIVTLILMAVIVWYSANLTLNDYQTGFGIAKILNPPKWPVEMIIPIGSILLFVQLCRNTYGNLMSLRALSGSKQM
jgi:TRAP-type C4-dicarboxylate transport system permease small subunit